MDEQQALKMAELALTSDVRMVVDLPLRSWWLIVCACQLQVAHPGIHEPLKGIVEQIGRKLQAQIVEVLPAVEELLEAGWHRENDYIEESQAGSDWFWDFSDREDDDDGYDDAPEGYYGSDGDGPLDDDDDDVALGDDDDDVL